MIRPPSLGTHLHRATLTICRNPHFLGTTGPHPLGWFKLDHRFFSGCMIPHNNLTDRFHIFLPSNNIAHITRWFLPCDDFAAPNEDNPYSPLNSHLETLAPEFLPWSRTK